MLHSSNPVAWVTGPHVQKLIRGWYPSVACNGTLQKYVWVPQKTYVNKKAADHRKGIFGKATQKLGLSVPYPQTVESCNFLKSSGVCISCVSQRIDHVVHHGWMLPVWKMGGKQRVVGHAGQKVFWDKIIGYTGRIWRMTMNQRGMPEQHNINGRTTCCLCGDVRRLSR